MLVSHFLALWNHLAFQFIWPEPTAFSFRKGKAMLKDECCVIVFNKLKCRKKYMLHSFVVPFIQRNSMQACRLHTLILHYFGLECWSANNTKKGYFCYCACQPLTTKIKWLRGEGVDLKHWIIFVVSYAHPKLIQVSTPSVLAWKSQTCVKRWLWKEKATTMKWWMPISSCKQACFLKTLKSAFLLLLKVPKSKLYFP
jgi:hypothetical protein